MACFCIACMHDAIPCQDMPSLHHNQHGSTTPRRSFFRKTGRFVFFPPLFLFPKKVSCCESSRWLAVWSAASVSTTYLRLCLHTLGPGWAMGSQFFFYIHTLIYPSAAELHLSWCWFLSVRLSRIFLITMWHYLVKKKLRAQMVWKRILH